METWNKLSKYASIAAASAIMVSCYTPETKDVLLYNGTVHTVNDQHATKNAVVIDGGKIVASGRVNELYAMYDFRKKIDLQGNHLYPAFMDAHTHFWAYAEGLGQVDLRGSASAEEVLKRLQEFDARFNPPVILGRGWDQSLWPDQHFPHRRLLDSLFAERPVVLKRIDGHAAWVNSRALKNAGIDARTRVDGGLLMQDEKGLTGILIDNAVELIQLPAPKVKDMRPLLLRAQDSLWKYGITAVMEAGLNRSQVELLAGLQSDSLLRIRIDALVSDHPENLAHYLPRGPQNGDLLRVAGFKFYLDGALGSRGALLTDGYADDSANYGLQLKPTAYFVKQAQKLYEGGWQMAIHAIGDSANELATRIMTEVLPENNDRRWRIEHAQIVREAARERMQRFNILPSVQPTHATSDMDWAGDRLGAAEIYAYPYRSLRKLHEHLPLGTDFPVEEIDPFKTYRAAVFRRLANGEPAGGYRVAEALQPYEALRGMTIDAAYASFWEDRLGTITSGKWADLVLLNRDLEDCEFGELPEIRVLATFSAGAVVYHDSLHFSMHP